MSRTSKLMAYVNWRMRITLSDTRQLVGTFLAFDRHMNLVLADTDEYRKIRPKKGATEEKEEKRTLGLVLLRGECVISLSAEAPPPPKPKAQVLVGGVKPPGVGTPAGRGAAIAPIGAAPLGLSGPVRGVGGAGGAVMQPQVGAPVAYAPPQPQYPPPPFAAGRGAVPPPGQFAYPPPPGAVPGAYPPQAFGRGAPAYPPPPFGGPPGAVGGYPMQPPPGAYPPPPMGRGYPPAMPPYGAPPPGAFSGPPRPPGQ